MLFIPPIWPIYPIEAGWPIGPIGPIGGCMPIIGLGNGIIPGFINGIVGGGIAMGCGIVALRTIALVANRCCRLTARYQIDCIVLRFRE
jgi:hypothetical protein